MEAIQCLGAFVPVTRQILDLGLFEYRSRVTGEVGLRETDRSAGEQCQQEKYDSHFDLSTGFGGRGIIGARDYASHADSSH